MGMQEDFWKTQENLRKIKTHKLSKEKESTAAIN